MRTTFDLRPIIVLLAGLIGVSLAHAQPASERLCADVNSDGAVTAADFSAWIAAFNLNDPIADINQDGSVTPADFSAWIAAFNLGEAGPRCNTQVTSGLSVSGAISPQGDTDSYTIFANAGDDLYLTIAETPSSNLFLEVSIYTPNGSLINSNFTQGGFRLDAFDVPQTGTYTYIVRDRGTATGAYTLTAVRAGGNANFGDVALTSGAGVTDSLALGDIDTFTINAVAGDDLFLTIAETPSADLFLEVSIHAPDGSLIGWNFTQGGFRLDAFDVPQTGTYTYIVRDRGIGTGSYTMTPVRAGGNPNLGDVPLISGDSISDALELGDIDTFTITALAGDDLYLSIAETPSSDLFLEVSIHAPDGSQITWNFTQGGFRIDAFDVPQTGTYTYVVRDRGIGTGSYTLTALRAGGTTNAGDVSLTSGDPESDSLVLGDIDTFTIDAVAGDDLLLTIAETPSSGLFLEVYIHAPDGDLITWNFAQGSFPLNAFDVPQTGTYTYIVRDRGIGTGDYTLTVVRAGG